MRLIFRIAVLLIFLFPASVFAQEHTASKIPRVLFLLDGSSSMSEDWAQGRSRFQQAGRFILSLIDSLSRANGEVEFGLRVFGHQYPSQQKNCYDTKLEIKFSRYNTTQMQARLEALHGYGVSPIAFSLSEAAQEDFEDERKYAYSIILVTDGGESCDGNICKVVNDLLQRKIFFRPYIVSLVDYAPLKDLYQCLGTFLTVSTEPQMPQAISKITDAHREGFVRARTGTVIPVMPDAQKPDTIVVPISIKEPPRKRDTVIIPVRKKEEPKPVKGDTITIPINIKEEPKKPVHTEPAKVPELQLRSKKIIKALKLKTNLKTFRTIIIDPPSPVYLAIPPYRWSDIADPPKAEIAAPPAERKKIKSLTALRFAPRKPVRKALTVIPSPKKIPVPAFVMAVIEIPAPEKVKPPVEPKPVVKPVVKAAEKPLVRKAESNYVVEKEPAQETLVEVYFTDGNGKFYSTTPQVLLAHPVTNKTVHQFYRTVNPDGNPDPVRTPSGSFNLSIAGSEKTLLKAIEISPNMKNKIIITVSNGSLQFVWKDSDGKKPVDKYYAVVKRNFVPQPAVKQRCDTILPYPPGNYHIEINTLPVSVRSVDLSFGATVIIPIDQPGIVQVSNTNDLGKVMFYFQLGDKFLPFYPMNIKGNPELQKVELRPGVYEVHFFLASGLPEKIGVFHVRSNETTSIELQ